MGLESDNTALGEPFRSEPAQLRGCGKPAVIGCLIVLLLVAAGLLLLMWKARDLLEYAIVQYQDAVIQSLPEDLSSEERHRLDRAFEAALAAIASEDLDPAGLQRLQRSLATPPRQGETLSREAVLDLIRSLEAVGGDAGGGGEGQRQVSLSGWAPGPSASNQVALVRYG